MRKRNLLTLTILLVAGLLIVGCARRLVGTPIKEENIPKIAIGETKREDIFRWFGTPYSLESKDNQEILTYLHGKELIWTAGLYTETQQSADILTVFIDEKGAVANYVFSKGVSTPEIYKRPFMAPTYAY